MSLHPIVSQLEQGFGGSYGDYLCLLLPLAGVVAALCRALDIFPIVAELNHLLNPQVLTFISVALWTIGNPTSIEHQYLTMLPFLVAIFLRFTGTSQDDVASSLSSVSNRLSSRIGEYTIIMFALPSFQSMARPQYVAPLMVFISTARTNEVFRAWNPRIYSPSEEDQVRKALESLLQLQGRSQLGNGHHHLQAREKSLFQLGFLWVDGSETLVLAALQVLMLSIVLMGVSLSLSRWLLICVEIFYGILALYLCVQCLPAWICCLDKFEILVRNDNRERLREVKGWASDAAFFLKSLTASGGFPFKSKSKLGLLLAFLEGIELAPHIVVASLPRFLLDSLVLFVAWIVNKTRLSTAWIVKKTRLDDLLTKLRLDKLLKLGDLPNYLWTKVRRFLVACATTICAQELFILKELFLDPPAFILVASEFHQMDSRSVITFSKRKHGSFQIPRNVRSTVIRNMMEGYSWIEAEGMIGYAYLEGTFVQLPPRTFSSGRESRGVVGGWISKGDTRSCEWGDSEYDEACCENVGHFFGELPFAPLLSGQGGAPTFKLWLKFGPKAVRISHLWENDESKIGGCTCLPNAHDHNVKLFGIDISSWPAQTTWKLALVNEALFQ